MPFVLARYFRGMERKDGIESGGVLTPFEDKLLFSPSDRNGPTQGKCFGPIPVANNLRPIYSASYLVSRDYISFKTGIRDYDLGGVYLWKYKQSGDWMTVQFVYTPDDKGPGYSATYHRIKSFKQYKLEHPNEFTK